MATTHQSGHYHGIDEDKYPVFKNSFSEKTRRDLIDEDLSAGKNVIGILIALVILGLAVGVMGLIFGIGY